MVIMPMGDQNVADIAPAQVKCVKAFLDRGCAAVDAGVDQGRLAVPRDNVCADDVQFDTPLGHAALQLTLGRHLGGWILWRRGRRFLGGPAGGR